MLMTVKLAAVAMLIATASQCGKGKDASTDAPAPPPSVLDVVWCTNESDPTNVEVSGTTVDQKDMPPGKKPGTIFLTVYNRGQRLYTISLTCGKEDFTTPELQEGIDFYITCRKPPYCTAKHHGD